MLKQRASWGFFRRRLFSLIPLLPAPSLPVVRPSVRLSVRVRVRRVESSVEFRKRRPFSLPGRCHNLNIQWYIPSPSSLSLI
jgi:hypothetical protein